VSGRGTVPHGYRSVVGVLLIGLLVAACGGRAPNAAPAGTASGSASAATSPAAQTAAAHTAAAQTASAQTGSASAATATSSSSPAPASTPVLAAGQVGSRSQVPWGQVGPGWFLVLSDSPTVWKGAESAPPPPGTLTMWLISPAGALYAITSWSGTGADPRNLAELAAWSGDARHALFLERGHGAIELDLTTGVLRQISVPNVVALGFTSPAGANLVADEDVSTADGTSVGEQLERLSLDGKPQVLLAETYRAETKWLYSADGATVYLNSWGGLRAVSNGGGPARALATFEGPDVDCAPASWWDQRTILASCNVTGGYQLWLVPVAGGAPKPLTAVPGSDAVGLGYNDAVQAGGSVFAQHLEGCGVVTIHRLAPSGVGSRIKIPQSLSNDRLIGTVGAKLAVESTTECGDPSWFGFYDPETNTVQKIIPDGPGELGAGSALAFP
jgi:hypothetical protein